MSIKIISCEVMKEEILSVKPNAEIEYEFISMGLHLYPEKLRNELQVVLDRSEGYSKVILSFGLCGGALRNLRASHCQLIIPRVHDCIPVLLGSKEAYERLSEEERGTFYLSCGWMLSEKSILSEHERICSKYGQIKAMSILSRMYDSYKRVLFIHTRGNSENTSLSQSKQIAELLQLEHGTIQGGRTFIEKIVNGPWDEEDFIYIPPTGIVKEEHFGICSDL